MYVVAALYHFTRLDDFKTMRAPLLDFCLAHKIKGTLLLAKEGINGTIAGQQQDIMAVIAYLQSDSRLATLVYKLSYDETPPFYRMKVKCKKEIVTMGVDDIDPNQFKGEYVSPQNWNALISDPDVVLIDTRNDYEVELGTFKGALDPKTHSFSELPEYVDNNLDPKQHKKVAMYCTGGIRCEKSTAYLRQQGFESVYHLEGGILKYLEEVDEKDSLWQGECYVFDNRVAVNHQLEKGQYDLCHGCRYPISEQDKQAEKYEEGVACPRCHDTLTDSQKARFRERQKQIQLAKARNQQHIGQAQQKETD